MDRIDLTTPVHNVKYAKLLRQTDHDHSDSDDTDRVLRARQVQAARFGRSDMLNADMTNTQLKRRGQLKTEAENILNAAARNLKLSARAYMRTVKVARTIADLDNSATITAAHLAEALTYRSQSV